MITQRIISLLLMVTMILVMVPISTMSAAAADTTPSLSLHSLFSDGAVLPRNTKFPIYGMVEPHAEVSVEINEKTYKTSADLNGYWSVEIDELSVANNPYTLTVSASTEESLTVSNLLAGDIWLCSGQSNMDHSMNTLASEEQYDYSSELDQIQNNDNIRFFIVQRLGTDERQFDVTGSKWESCTKETASNFSAVGYHFGQKLYDDINAHEDGINVPIGLIESAFSNTCIEYWISTDALAENGYSSRLNLQGTNNRGSGKLFNAMIAPLTDYKITGAIWYQGESNHSRYYEYLDMSKILLNEWRSEWGYDFPFIITQLAPYDVYEDNFIKIREAQRMFVEQTDNTDMAVILDAGDTERIHPKDKKTVGSRLALAAEYTAYNMDVQSKYPSPKEIIYSDESVTVEFDNSYNGLVTSDGSNSVAGFEVRNADGEFYEAKAELKDSDTIVVTSDTIKDIRGVRYGIKNSAGVSLFNSAGLIATPFADNWPDAIETFSSFETENTVPVANTYFNTTALNDLIISSGTSYRKVYPAKGIYGKDAQNTSLVLESSCTEAFTGGPYLNLTWLRNNSFASKKALHFSAQLAYEGPTDLKPGLVFNITGTQIGRRAYTNKSFISILNGKLLSFDEDTGISLEERKWYTFDVVIYPVNESGESAMGYELYCNGRKVQLSGEDRNGIKYFTDTNISDMKTINQVRLTYNDSTDGRVRKLVLDNVSMEVVSDSKFSTEPLTTVFSKDNDAVKADISLIKQTDISNAKIVVAKYSADNRLISINHYENHKLESGAVNLTVENITIGSDEYIKVFAWTSDGQLRPLDVADSYGN